MVRSDVHGTIFGYSPRARLTDRAAHGLRRRRSSSIAAVKMPERLAKIVRR